MKQIAVGAMELDGIDARPHRAFGGGDKGVTDTLHVRSRHSRGTGQFGPKGMS